MTRTIGEAIEGRLHEMKIKPEELATVLDVPLPTLSGWLWLENDIPAQYILKIAHVLRCTPTYLLSGGEDDRETPTKSDAIEDLIRATVAEVLRQQEAQKRRFIHLTAKLDALSPLKVLARGSPRTSNGSASSWSRSERSRPPNTATRSARCSTAWARSCWATRSRPHRLSPLRPRKHIHQFRPVFAPPLCDAKQHPASVQVFVRGIIVGSFKDLAHIGKIEIHEITPLWGL